MIVTEVDLAFCARVTRAEEAFRVSIDYKAVSRNIESDPTSGGFERSKIQVAEDRPVTLINSLQAQLPGNESRGACRARSGYPSLSHYLPRGAVSWPPRLRS